MKKSKVIEVWSKKRKSKETGEFFMGVPERWYESGPHYVCENGHVSMSYLKSEKFGNVCFACMKVVWMSARIN